jgi:hypothetical protein
LNVFQRFEENRVLLKGADKFWARVPHTKIRKNVHNNMCPETFNSRVIAGIILLRPVVTDSMTDPHVLLHRLTDNRYRVFISHDLPKLLEDVPLAVAARMWYMHDSAAAYFSRVVRNVLSNTYHERWIGKLQGIHVRQIWILWICNCGHTYTHVCIGVSTVIHTCVQQRKGTSPSQCGWLPLKKKGVRLSLQQAVEAHAGRQLPLGWFLVLISVRGSVEPRAKARLLEGLGQLKNPMTSPGIETATFRLVV